VFKRALQHENLVAEATAREVGHVSLGEVRVTTRPPRLFGLWPKERLGDGELAA